MMREYPVRFCEGLGVKVPGPTRQSQAWCGWQFAELELELHKATSLLADAALA
jgi:hypothetical protein